MARWVPTFAGTTLLLLVAVQASHGQAQGSADFYQGKTLRIVISTGVAGGFGEYARLLSEHIGKHIPGRPHVIVQSMPGAGGLLAANFLYASAPQDGTTIGIINSTVPFAPLWGSKGARFDTLKFNWLGTLDRAEGVCTLWHTSPVKTWADMLVKEFTVGSIGAGSEMELYPAMLNKLFATRIKVIAGYKAGSDIDLAMERGELDGRCGTHLTSFKALHPGWFKPEIGDWSNDRPDHPIGVRHFEEIIKRSAAEHWTAWQNVRLSQLNAELAVQVHSLARKNHAKHLAVRRLYLGLRAMALMLAFVLLLYGVFSLV